MFSDVPVKPSAATSSLWSAIEKLLLRKGPDASSLHGLGPLYARFVTRSGSPVPASLAAEDHWTRLGIVTAVPLLQSLRESCSGPLVLMKGAEVALRYPDTARMFVDIDLLVPDARRVRRELLDAGFEEVGDPELFYRIHHLRPLMLPNFPLFVEIHSAPKWPERLSPPSVGRIIDDARPSQLGVEGLLAPEPAQHAILLAAHAWAHEPLLRLRDLVDVAAVAAEADREAIDATAHAWGIAPLWRTTRRAADAVLLGRGRSLATQIWARHLPALRERTVFENHVQQWVSGYWGLPVRAALAQTAAAALNEIRPASDEGWREKWNRAGLAIKRAGSPRSQHDALLGDSAMRGRGRNLPDDDVDGSL